MLRAWGSPRSGMHEITTNWPSSRGVVKSGPVLTTPLFATLLTCRSTLQALRRHAAPRTPRTTELYYKRL